MQGESPSPIVKHLVKQIAQGSHNESSDKVQYEQLVPTKIFLPVFAIVFANLMYRSPHKKHEEKAEEHH